MVESRRGALAFRLTFVVYAVGLLFWLALGLLPTLSTELGWAARAAAAMSQHPGTLGRAAGRVLRPTAMAMSAVPVWKVSVEYLFSLLNVALGLVLVLRRPDELVARLLGFALLGTAATFNMPSHRVFDIIGKPWPVQVVHFAFHIVSGVTYLWAVVVFPDGAVPRGLRVDPPWGGLIVVAVTTAAGVVCWRSSFLAHPQFFVVFFGVAISVAGYACQGLRLADPTTGPAQRRTARLVQAALLLPLMTAAVWLAARAARAVGAAGWARTVDLDAQAWFPAVFAVVPVVLAAGIVRYRLWDVDRLLSGLLVSAAVSVVVAAGYVAAVVSSGWLAGGGVWWTVAVLALTVVLVEPVRLRARRWSNRVVFGQVLNPAEAIGRLVAGLEQLTPTAELDQLTDVCVQATRASRVELWLVEDDRLVWAAQTPPPGRAPAVCAFTPPERAADVLVAAAAALGSSHVWPVTHQGELLGFLTATMPSGDPMPAAEQQLIVDVSVHAGLVVHNTVLAVRLARQVAALEAHAERLRASRRHLVAAQDRERRHLERDLHDGAQQTLVAAIIGLRMAAFASSALSGAAGADRSLVTDVGEVLGLLDESRRDLTEVGAHPGTVVPGGLGLGAGLRRLVEVSRHAGLTVRLEVAGVDPDPAESRDGEQAASDAEGAVYFCCAEALQNVAKHARAATVTVHVERTRREWTFVVTDDGIGFDARDADPAGGLGHLGERLAPVGGWVRLQSSPGVGTRFWGAVPSGAGWAAPEALPATASTPPTPTPTPTPTPGPMRAPTPGPTTPPMFDPGRTPGLGRR